MLTYSYFDIPEECIVNQDIPIHMFRMRMVCSISEFMDNFLYVDRIIEKYKISSKQFSIKPGGNLEEDYSEIHIIEVHISSTYKMDKVARAIYHSIPYPLILVFIWNNKFCFSSAFVRTSRLDEEANRLFAPMYTYWIDESLLFGKKKKIHMISVPKILEINEYSMKDIFRQIYNFIIYYSTNSQSDLLLSEKERKKIEREKEIYKRKKETYNDLCSGQSDYYLNEYDERTI